MVYLITVTKSGGFINNNENDKYNFNRLKQNQGNKDFIVYFSRFICSSSNAGRLATLSLNGRTMLQGGLKD
jgi:hypothetical protein